MSYSYIRASICDQNAIAPVISHAAKAQPDASVGRLRADRKSRERKIKSNYKKTF
jgi:hypothetical protein